MPIKIVISGVGLGLSFAIATHYFAGAHQLEIFALFLALTSCVYGGAILTPAGAKYSFIELPFVIIVFTLSILGLVFTPLYLAIGYLVHGVWDSVHHFRKVHTPIVSWFPPMCAAFDVLMAFVIVWLWYTGS